MTDSRSIPFYKPSLDQAEIDEVVDTLKSGWLTTGPKTKQFESEFAAYVGRKHAVAVNSCTAALHLALESIGLKAGEGVIVPTLTFAATAEVVRYFGARPILADCRENDFNLDVKDAERRILDAQKAGIKVVAMIPVHYGGQIGDVAGYTALARRHGLRIIEDAAHCCPAYYRAGSEKQGAEGREMGDRRSEMGAGSEEQGGGTPAHRARTIGPRDDGTTGLQDHRTMGLRDRRSEVSQPPSDGGASVPASPDFALSTASTTAAPTHRPSDGGASVPASPDLAPTAAPAHRPTDLPTQRPTDPWLPVGASAEISCFSFYANKTITTGEGGMACTDNDAFADRMRIMSLHGISRDAWKRFTAQGNWYYEIVAPGYKYNLTDIASAIGIHQVRKADAFHRRRVELVRLYQELLGDMDELILPAQEPDRIHSWHLFVVRLRLDRIRLDRAQAIDRLKAAGIGVSVHYLPLHMHPYYRDQFGYRPDDLPVAARLYPQLITLPLYPSMTDDDVRFVCSQLRGIVGDRR